MIGIGGVGHMAIKFARTLGATVVALTASPGKIADARRLGADEVLVTSDPGALKAAKERFDLLLDTVSKPHDLDSYLSLVKCQGDLVLLGTPPNIACAPLSLVFRQKRLRGSFIGGLHETQEMLEFCGGVSAPPSAPRASRSSPRASPAACRSHPAPRSCSERRSGKPPTS